MKFALPALLLVLSLTTKAESIKINQATPVSVNEPIDVPTSFTVDNSVGNIEIYEAPGRQMIIDATMTGNADAKINIDRKSGIVAIGVQYPSGASGNSNSSISITSGNGAFIQISGGSISGGVQIDSLESGVVKIGGQTFELKNGQSLHLGSVGSGSVTLKIGLPSETLANLKANSTSGKISVRGSFVNGLEAQREVALETGSSDISCIGMCSLGSIKVKASMGDVALKNIRGNIEVQTDNGNIATLQTNGPLNIRGSMGGIQVANHRNGPLTVKTSSGDINTLNTDGPLSLVNSMGAISVSAHIDGSIVASSSSGNIKVSESAGAITATTSMGGIQILGHRTDSIQATTSMGSINLEIPDSFTPRTKTSMGSIKRRTFIPGPDLCARVMKRTI